MRNYDPSWTNKEKRAYLKQRVDDEARAARVFAEEQEWAEVEKALVSMREALVELYELVR